MAVLVRARRSGVLVLVGVPVPVPVGMTVRVQEASV